MARARLLCSPSSASRSGWPDSSDTPSQRSCCGPDSPPSGPTNRLQSVAHFVDQNQCKKTRRIRSLHRRCNQATVQGHAAHAGASRSGVFQRARSQDTTEQQIHARRREVPVSFRGPGKSTTIRTGFYGWDFFAIMKTDMPHGRSERVVFHGPVSLQGRELTTMAFIETVFESDCMKYKHMTTRN